MRFARRILLGLLVLLLVAAAYLFLYPAPIDPAAWTPPSPPGLPGEFAANDRLRATVRLADGLVVGPEDVAVDPAGRVYGGLADGSIVRVDPEGVVTTFAVTGGRPLGLHFDAAGRLVVCDAHRGLLSIDPEGRITTLATEAEGVPFRFTNDLDIGQDGTIYFTDASSRFTQPDYLLDLLEARPHGRFLAYDPATKQARVLMRDLYFANGVALSRNEDFVLVNETYRYRIRRYWLKGPWAGRDDVFAENLPGFPDGISADRRGTFWLALYTVRNERLDSLHPSPFKKRLVSKLPRALWPAPKPYAFVAAFDEAGDVVESLHDPTGDRVRFVTSVESVGDRLYLGTLKGDWIGVVDRSAKP